MNEFYPRWQFKPWVIVTLFLACLALVALNTSCAVHRQPARVSIEYSEQTAMPLHKSYADNQICREEPYPGHIR